MTELSHSQKIQQVHQWILEGRTEPAIKETIADQWPEEDAGALLIEALYAIREFAGRSHVEIEQWSLDACRFVYEQLVSIGEFGGALRAIKQMLEISANRTGQPGNVKRVEHHHHFELGRVTNANLEDIKARLALEFKDVIETSVVSRGSETNRRTPAGRKGKAGRKPKQ